MVLFVNVMFEYESFDDWSWLRTGGGGGGGGGGGRCGKPEIMGSSHCLYYFSVFMCKAGLFQPKGRKKRGVGHSTHGLFYTKDRHFNIMVLTHHNQ